MMTNSQIDLPLPTMLCKKTICQFLLFQNKIISVNNFAVIAVNWSQEILYRLFDAFGFLFCQEND